MDEKLRFKTVHRIISMGLVFVMVISVFFASDIKTVKAMPLWQEEMRNSKYLIKQNDEENIIKVYDVKTGNKIGTIKHTKSTVKDGYLVGSKVYYLADDYPATYLYRYDITTKKKTKLKTINAYGYNIAHYYDGSLYINATLHNDNDPYYTYRYDISTKKLTKFRGWFCSRYNNTILADTEYTWAEQRHCLNLYNVKTRKITALTKDLISYNRSNNIIFYADIDENYEVYSFRKYDLKTGKKTLLGKSSKPLYVEYVTNTYAYSNSGKLYDDFYKYYRYKYSTKEQVEISEEEYYKVVKFKP